MAYTFRIFDSAGKAEAIEAGAPSLTLDATLDELLQILEFLQAHDRIQVVDSDSEEIVLTLSSLWAVDFASPAAKAEVGLEEGDCCFT
jgi:hypothetical protein